MQCERVNNLAHQHFWGRGSCGQAEGADIVEPVQANLFRALHQIGLGAGSGRNLNQTLRVRTVGCADDKDKVAFMRNRLDRFLAVGRRVTNILTPWPDDIGEALLKDQYDFRCIIDRQSRLRQK